MITALLFLLVLFWFLGYIRIEGVIIPDVILFTINGQPITLWSILILLVVGWIVSLLVSPFREIMGILLLIWILSILGIIAINGIALSNILVVAMIIGVVASLFSRSTP